ncbi:ZIP zinc transporter-domain-containing protein [Mycena rosella]|uniref:ZIP zinc transporter-domain-containing protein n=1 Tax=Mycena rosella TaxID=1033263 RepID=A0AAD7DA08_MYCRO|nr:ZIP zinc transporter-domain-containing protein [Mycena rosella]
MSTSPSTPSLGPGISAPPTLHHRACTPDSLAGSIASPSDLGLRVAALFVILAGSTLGALFPVLATSGAGPSSLRVSRVRVSFISRINGTNSRIIVIHYYQNSLARYVGSGVIVRSPSPRSVSCSAHRHGLHPLLAPAIDALGSPCLSPGWHKYPYALGLCLLSILSLFVAEIATARGAAAHLAKAEGRRDLDLTLSPDIPLEADERGAPEAQNNSVRVVGIVILEFGAVLHSVLIGLTLAAAQKFKVLFAVLVTHQVFEGLGIGSRLASVPGLPTRVRVGGAIVFGLSTPLGMAVGLAVRASYSADDPGALVVSGVLDALSAGILVYTGLVELLAREILFNEELMKGPTSKLAVALGWVFLGCCVMALLGRWV